jgi:hypothetical protein
MERFKKPKLNLPEKNKTFKPTITDHKKLNLEKTFIGPKIKSHGIEYWRREEIKQRDNYQCQICGYKEEPHALETHHLLFRKNKYLPPETINQNKYILTTCKNCHTEHHIKIKKQNPEEAYQTILKLLTTHNKPETIPEEIHKGLKKYLTQQSD